MLANDSDVEGDVLTIVEVSDPFYGGVVINPDHTITYTPPENYNGMAIFSYTISDGHGGTATAMVEVMVLGVNDPPVADAGGPYVIDEGDALRLDGGMSSDPDEYYYGDTIVSYEWDLDNDGQYDDATEEMVTVPWAALVNLGLVVGTHNITLRVTDSYGASAECSATLVVNNVARRLSGLMLTPQINEGDVAVLRGVVSDPGTDNTFTLVLDWGDGRQESVVLDNATPGVTFDLATGAFTVAHRYLDDGPSPGNGTAWDQATVTGSVWDNHGGSSPLANSPWPLLEIDPPEGGGMESQIRAYMPLGQSFRALSDRPLLSLSLFVTDMNQYSYPDDHSLEFAVYEGEGTTGLLLGTRLCTGLTDGFRGFVDLDFSDVSLVTGQMYTVVARNDTSRWGLSFSSLGYSDGVAIFKGGLSPASPYWDALFRIQWQAEPASLTVRIDNVSPELHDLAVSPSQEGGLAVLTGTITDVGVLDAGTVAIDWGDGTPTESFPYAAGTVSFGRHPFLSSGRHLYGPGNAHR